MPDVQEAKQLEEARLKLAKEQKKKQDMEAAARLAGQRKAAEQAARQQVEADMQKKRNDRQSKVCLTQLLECCCTWRCGGTVHLAFGIVQ